MNNFYTIGESELSQADKNAEKSEFKRTVIKLGIFGAVTVLNNFFLIYIFIYPAVWIINAVGDSLSYELWYLINWLTNELCVYFFPMLTVFLLFRRDFKAPNTYKGLTPREYLPIMPLIFLSSTFLGSTASIITNIVADTMDKLFGTGQISDAMEGSMPSEGQSTSLWIAMFFLVIAAPICEELMVRKLILYPLRKHGDWFAIIASSLIFGFIHGNWDQLPYAFVVGVLYGLLAVRANSIIPTLILHAVNNLLVTAGSYLTQVTGETEPFVSIQQWVVSAVNLCFWLGIMATVILGVTKFYKSDRLPVLTAKEKAAEMVRNPAAYVFAAALIMLLIF